MTFLDTCVWLEVCAVSSPSSQREQLRMQRASNLLAKLQDEGEIIVTCKEQLIEVVQAVQKIKLREWNRTCKMNQCVGVGSLKEFRDVPEFANSQKICRQIINDIKTLSQEDTLSEVTIATVIDNLHLVDINDFLYYQYCAANGVNFYTFDKDFLRLTFSNYIHIL